MMPEVDRKAASQAAIAARRARAEVKRRLRDGELPPLRALENSLRLDTAEASLRVTDFLQTLPAVGKVKTERILQELGISPRKRLGGLGVKQRERLDAWLRERQGVTNAPPVVTVLAGPTAVGKGTVVRHLLEHRPEVRLSVSATTRDPRPGEEHGVHYYFVSNQDFDRMLARNELLEWATVHGVHRYGTPREPVYQAADRGEHVLLEIDIQGARQVRASEPGARLVFLAPPSWEELVRRLEGRGTEDEEERQRRLATARVELAAAEEFDHVIVNEDVAEAAQQLFCLLYTSDAADE